SSPPRATSCGRRSPWCRDSPAPWPVGGTSCPTPNGAPRCRPSPTGRGRWASWSSSCCSARARAPTSRRGRAGRSPRRSCCAVRSGAGGEGHALTADIPGGRPQAHGDVTATDVIVGQLLENAYKYSPDGGAVTVRARPAGEWIEVTVDDEGIGIAPGDHERIFERFVQGETGDRRRFGGIGLGLYIVRQLARAQDGEVAASSRPGGGTRMSLQLRRAAMA